MIARGERHGAGNQKRDQFDVDASFIDFAEREQCRHHRYVYERKAGQPIGPAIGKQQRYGDYT